MLIDNLVSYWKFDESSGNAEDSHGANDLTNNGVATFGAGKINNATDLEAGSSQYFSIADASQSGLDITGDLSVSMWVNFETIPTATDYAYVVKKINGGRAYHWYQLDEGGTQKMVLELSTDGSDSPSVNVAWTPSTATWYHVAFTFEAATSEVKFFVDGSQQSTTQSIAASSIFNGDGPFQVGAYFFNSAGGFFDGIIDEVGIWNRVLTAGEITSLYNGGNSLAYPLTTSPIWTIALI